GFAERRATIRPGETLVLFTDGVTEALDGADRLFSEERLAAFLAASGDLPAARLTRAIVDAVERFADGAAQADDITCLALRFTPRNNPLPPSGGAGQPP